MGPNVSDSQLIGDILSKWGQKPSPRFGKKFIFGSVVIVGGSVQEMNVSLCNVPKSENVCVCAAPAHMAELQLHGQIALALYNNQVSNEGSPNTQPPSPSKKIK